MAISLKRTTAAKYKMKVKYRKNSKKQSGFTPIEIIAVIIIIGILAAVAVSKIASTQDY